jgi:hypothetical protein
MSRVKKRRKKATVDFSVQRRRMVVKMNQPCGCGQREREALVNRLTTYHQEEAEGVKQPCSTVRSLDASLNFEPSGRQNDGERNPETTIRRERSGTESVTNGHLPVIQISGWTQKSWFVEPETYHMPAKS